jgi:hypothetical protein
MNHDDQRQPQWKEWLWICLTMVGSMLNVAALSALILWWTFRDGFLADG